MSGQGTTNSDSTAGTTGTGSDGASEVTPATSPERSVDLLPNEQRAIEPWVEATDEDGTVRSTKKPLEPDSLGG